MAALWGISDANFQKYSPPPCVATSQVPGREHRGICRLPQRALANAQRTAKLAAWMELSMLRLHHSAAHDVLFSLVLTERLAVQHLYTSVKCSAT